MPLSFAERKIYMRRYYIENKAKLDRQSLEWGNKQRNRILTLLGGKCVRCGMEDSDVLTVDHIHHDGGEERKRHQNQRTIFARILKDGHGGRYQLLCCNCNWKKEIERRRNAKHI